jgi:replicative DNA helicase
VANAKKNMLRGDGLAGISTGYPSLDRILRGMQSRPVHPAGGPARASARPPFGLGIAVRAAASWLPEQNRRPRVAYWSGEMGEAQLGARMAAAHTNLPTTAVFTGYGVSSRSRRR